ncbi:DUF3761 domain-containing protein [Streptacidiphilus sp. PAMC 29251]
MLTRLRVRTAGTILALTAAFIAPTTLVSAAPAVAATAHCAHHTVGVCKASSPHSRGAMAKCKDGTYSYSAHFSGTCSHHKGVRYWYK